MEKDNRKHKVTFRMNDEEYEIFLQKFKKANAKSQGEFVRKMIMNGVVLHFDESKAKQAFRTLSTVANNINQIAVRVNSTNNIYREDVQQLRANMEELWQQLNCFQSIQYCFRLQTHWV